CAVPGGLSDTDTAATHIDTLSLHDALPIYGKHYVVYQGVDDLLEKLEYYLAHLDRAQKIATRGHRYVLAHHTYAHRAKVLLQIIDRKSTRLNSSHVKSSSAVFCLKKKICIP